jgi:ribosomal protein L24E
MVVTEILQYLHFMKFKNSSVCEKEILLKKGILCVRTQSRTFVILHQKTKVATKSYHKAVHPVSCPGRQATRGAETLLE